jgi:hypothetical protein
MDVNTLPEVNVIADAYDIILVDKGSNEGKRMDADGFISLVLSDVDRKIASTQDIKEFLNI